MCLFLVHLASKVQAEHVCGWHSRWLSVMELGFVSVQSPCSHVQSPGFITVSAPKRKRWLCETTVPHTHWEAGFALTWFSGESLRGPGKSRRRRR